jgi:hypothetical protein
MKMMIEFFFFYILCFVYFSNNFKFVLTFCVLIKTVMVLINTLFTLCHCVTKRGSIFFVFRPEMYFQTGQVFLSQNGQRGSLLVF